MNPSDAIKAVLEIKIKTHSLKSKSENLNSEYRLRKQAYDSLCEIIERLTEIEKGIIKDDNKMIEKLRDIHEMDEQ